MSGEPASHEDVVGERVLVGLQSVHISRLSAHPIPVAAGTLIAVAGQGPKDSNGAGKSSLIAQVSLVHADEQWRFGSGAPSAPELLFNAEDAGGEDKWGSADHGYVIGVFAPPAARTVDDLEAGALTVWIRIDRSGHRGPRLKLRWQDGLHLPTGSCEADREQAADSLWQALEPRAVRQQDLSARDLPRTLFGEHVRCVSFLSTSVRASVTPNLLAQPLNEITARRIFEAIAALTGIDRELEHELKARREEHDTREKTKQAEAELLTWEENAEVLENGLDARDRARELVTEASERWRSRTARLLHDALRRDADIRDEINRLDRETERDSAQAKKLADQVSALADDQAFASRRKTARTALDRLSEQDRDLDKKIAALDKEVEETDERLRAVRETARDADGRDEAAANAEHDTADLAQKTAFKAAGVAEKALEDTQSRLQAAESGQDLAWQQIERLTASGIDALALLDAVVLNEAERDRWEPVLWPYRDAAVVDSGELSRAGELLAGMPGSVLVAANRPVPGSAGPVPASADPQFDLTGFLTALRARTTALSGPSRAGDDAGIVIVGGFPDPVTGRAARIAAAREQVSRASADDRAASGDVQAAQRQVAVAKRRQQGARAAAEVSRLEGQITRARQAGQTAREERARLAPALRAAQAEQEEVLRLSGAREARANALRQEKSTLDTANNDRRKKREELDEERTRLELPHLAAQWDGTGDSAQEHLLALPEDQQAWTAGDWWDAARGLIDAALSWCFPTAATASVPAEIALQQKEFGQQGPAGVRSAQAAFPRLLRALGVYLFQHEESDRYQRRRVAEERQERHASLKAAQLGQDEAILASQASRDALADAIASKLAQVSAEFDRLDRDYGGYGAALRYEIPPPPTDPAEAWDWRVTPQWRRAEGRPLIPYNRRANTAQVDDRAIKLVCAAATASGTGRPLVLVLDELGRNLGKQHRREAVALLGQIGRDSGITVVGALQDDMESYAIDACGEYVKLRRASDSSPYNEQPVVVGHDEHTARVELLRSWLTGNEYRETA